MASIDIGYLVGGILSSVATGVGKIIANPINPISVVAASAEMVTGILSAVGVGLAFLPRTPEGEALTNKEL
ncbi:hypothetical protein BKA69DRAFT_1061113 [Paraphysoderma sedebokerense]|nr:hypothetical protein BKA69DRAFT_1061113 [Paraphysoderma sedebokerense]